MKRIIFVFFNLLVFSLLASTQQFVEVEHEAIEPPPSWEIGYQDRLNHILNDNPDLDCRSRSNRGDPDNGKRYWPLFLCDLNRNVGNQAEFERLITDRSDGGYSGINGQYEGVFYKPFSVPGYIRYLFTYYDDIERLDPDQLTTVENKWNNPNKGFTMRADGDMDPIYVCTEMNSENFHFMSRMGGYVLSHYFNDPDTSFFDDWMKNAVRATFNMGRTEWNSHVYTGWVLFSSENVLQFGHTKQFREKGRALQDWVSMEFAVKHLNGHDIGADSRNKAGTAMKYDRSFGAYAYLWFADHDKGIPSNFTGPEVADTIPVANLSWYVGYLPLKIYRPSQAIIDIAQGLFDKPVEIRSAKPHYKSDDENFGHWAGLGHGVEDNYGERFEFETRYIHDNYMLSSVAAGRPDKVNCFAEIRTWEMGVRNMGYTVFGSTGNGTYGYGSTGRDNNEQIAQLSNSMMLLYKGPVSGDKSWIAIPNEDAGLQSYEWDGNTLFLDMGSDVYMAVIPYNTVATDFSDTLHVKYFPHHYRFEWQFPPTTDLSALIVEMGTLEEHGSYANFKEQIRTNTQINEKDGNRLEYVSTLGDVMDVEFQFAPEPYEYVHTNAGSSTCNYYTIPADERGYYPKVYYNGVLNDYQTWNQYEVTQGERILHSNWGDGVITVASDSNALRISVDPVTAEVKYEKWEGPVDREEVFKDVVISEERIIEREEQANVSVYPNPSDAGFYIRFSEDFVNADVSVYNMNGSLVEQHVANASFIELGSQLNPGIYVVKIKTEQDMVQRKIIKK